MDRSLFESLKRIAMERLPADDPSHDFMHALRVLKNATAIAEVEGGDVRILVPAALFHDIVNIPKHTPDAPKASLLSANAARDILHGVPDYPAELIPEVWRAVKECSFKNALKPSSWESAVQQDADMLEAVGAVAIMRTFSSTGLAQRPFYHPIDPFCENREPEPQNYALDIFRDRLLQVVGRMNTKTGRVLAKARTAFLHTFLEQLQSEI
jgi:uncharacterized protein